jgi:hypothetical protein
MDPANVLPVQLFECAPIPALGAMHQSNFVQIGRQSDFRLHDQTIRRHSHNFTHGNLDAPDGQKV